MEKQNEKINELEKKIEQLEIKIQQLEDKIDDIEYDVGLTESALINKRII